MQDDTQCTEQNSNEVQNHIPDQRFLFGFVGAVLAGFIGLVVWYYLTLITNYELGIVAWGIGGLVGYVALLCARTGSRNLAICAAIVTALSIIGGQLVFTYDVYEKQLDMEIQTVYGQEIEFGKRVIVANDTTSERLLIAELKCEGEDEKPNPSEVTEEEEAIFRDEVRPYYSNLVNGTITQEEYTQDVKASAKENIPHKAILLDSVSFYTILWLFFGVGSAFKIASKRG